jgi:hypothetical protein
LCGRLTKLATHGRQAIFWGWLVFGDLPTRHVLVSAAIILCSGVAMLIVEGRRRTARA